MAPKSQLRNDCEDPHRAELIAAREGLLFVWELGFQRVILEGDAKVAYSSIKENRDDFPYNGSILRDIFLYASWFDCFDCGFVPRSCNSIANFLANKALAGDLEVWMEDPPTELIFLLVANLSYIE